LISNDFLPLFINDLAENERSVLGAEGRGFESLRPDQCNVLIIKAIFPFPVTHLLFATSAL
jgi:hypothetical protein